MGKSGRLPLVFWSPFINRKEPKKNWKLAVNNYNLNVDVISDLCVWFFTGSVEPRSEGGRFLIDLFKIWEVTIISQKAKEMIQLCVCVLLSVAAGFVGCWLCFRPIFYELCICQRFKWLAKQIKLHTSPGFFLYLFIWDSLVDLFCNARFGRLCCNFLSLIKKEGKKTMVNVIWFLFFFGRFKSYRVSSHCLYFE